MLSKSVKIKIDRNMSAVLKDCV